MCSEEMDKILDLVKLCMKNGIEFNLSREGEENEGVYNKEESWVKNLV
mgnify:CR=1 FL=1